MDEPFHSTFNENIDYENSGRFLSTCEYVVKVCLKMDEPYFWCDVFHRYKIDLCTLARFPAARFFVCSA